jgi:peptidoglycan hydrolase-like protein with peptidoglycan-binding domain
MSLVRRLLLAAAIAALLCSTAFVAGYALKGGPSPTPTASGTGGVPADEPSPTVSETPTPTATPTATPVTDDPTPSETPKPVHTPKPTLEPGTALLSPGDEGDQVRDLQARLKQIYWFNADVSGTYGDVTEAAVRGFQAKREIPVTGEVDRRTLDRLTAMTTRQHTRRARRALQGRSGPVHRQDQLDAALRRGRQGRADARRALRRLDHADSRGRVPRLPQGRRPRVAPLRVVDAVLDVLRPRAGGALLVGLRDGGVRRGVARLREHP